MRFQLLKQFLLVELVYPREGLSSIIHVFPTLALPNPDMRSVDKPEGPVFVPWKFCLHSENLMTMNLLNKVAHLKALLEAVSLFFSSPEELLVISEPFVVIVDFRIDVV